MKKKIVTLLLVAAMTGTMVVVDPRLMIRHPIRRQNRRMIKRIQRKRKSWQMMNTSMYPQQIQ